MQTTGEMTVRSCYRTRTIQNPVLLSRTYDSRKPGGRGHAIEYCTASQLTLLFKETPPPVAGTLHS